MEVLEKGKCRSPRGSNPMHSDNVLGEKPQGALPHVESEGTVQTVRDEGQHRRAGKVAGWRIKLARRSCRRRPDGKMEHPWGLDICNRTMRLLGCPEGAAARSKNAHKCIGMVLIAINGTRARSPNVVRRLIDEQTSIELSFHEPTPTRPPAIAAPP